jgi:hypothetical protein
MRTEDYQALITEHGRTFTLSEWQIQGPVTKMNPQHFEQVLKFRQWHGFSTLLSSTWREGNKGYHPLGLATDQILFKKFKEEPLSPIHQWNLATTFGFPGVGLYFDWDFTNKAGKSKRTCGLHVDNGYKRNRPLRWICKEHEVWEEGILVAVKQFYYYQDLATGLFYNQERDEEISLQTAIQTWWQS